MKIHKGVTYGTGRQQQTAVLLVTLCNGRVLEIREDDDDPNLVIIESWHRMNVGIAENEDDDNNVQIQIELLEERKETP